MTTVQDLLRWRRSWIERSRRARRVAFYFFCVFAVLSLLAARVLYAHVQDAARALGHELAGISDLTSGAETVLLNGARFHHAAIHVPESISAVLDAVEAHCQKSTGLFTSTMRELERQHGDQLDKFPDLGSIRRGVFREESETGGMLVCFVGQGNDGLTGLKRAAERFMATSDLSAFGFLRYATAKRLKDGSTQVMVLWTDGEVSLSKMFPATGDAEGSDSRELPRPPNARRTLTAAANGMSFALRMYESRDQRPSLERFYDHRLTQKGWRVAAKVSERGTSSYLHPDGRQAFVTLSEANERTYVTMIEAGRADATAVAGTRILE
jgi:hypothetical protein